MQASVPQSTQIIVLLVALCTDTDPLEVQRSYMDSQHFLRLGFNKLVTGQAARERLEQNISGDPKAIANYEKKMENDT